MTEAPLELNQRFDQLDDFIRDGRLTRRAWVKMNGEEKLCLLAALSPECATHREAKYCPVELMPRWMASLVLWFSDTGTAEFWKVGVLTRFPKLIRASVVFTLGDWEHLELMMKRALTMKARAYITSEAALSAVDVVIALLDQSLAGEFVSRERWKRAYWDVKYLANVAEPYQFLAAMRVVLKSATIHYSATEWAAESLVGAKQGRASSPYSDYDVVIAFLFDVWEDKLKHVSSGKKENNEPA